MSRVADARGDGSSRLRLLRRGLLALGGTAAGVLLGVGIAGNAAAEEPDSGVLNGITSVVAAPVDTVADVTRRAASPAASVVEQAASAALPALEAVPHSVSETSEAVRPVVEAASTVTEPVASATDPVAQTVQSAVTASESLTAPVTEAVSTVVATTEPVTAPVTETVETAVAAAKPLTAPVQDTVATAVSTAEPLVAPVREAVESVVTVVEPVTESLTPITDPLTPIAEAAQEPIERVAGSIVPEVDLATPAADDLPVDRLDADASDAPPVAAATFTSPPETGTADGQADIAAATDVVLLGWQADVGRSLAPAQLIVWSPQPPAVITGPVPDAVVMVEPGGEGTSPHGLPAPSATGALVGGTAGPAGGSGGQPAVAADVTLIRPDDLQHSASDRPSTPWTDAVLDIAVSPG